MEFEVPVGSEIYWKSPNQKLAGGVRYCANREIGYVVGVEYAPGRKWYRSAYEPQHRLDVDKLLG